MNRGMKDYSSKESELQKGGESSATWSLPDNFPKELIPNVPKRWFLKGERQSQRYKADEEQNKRQ